MSTVVALSLILCGATKIWVEPPLARVFPQSAPARDALKEVHIQAARGERESFQLCIRSDAKGLEKVNVDLERVSDVIGAPEVRRVGYLVTGGGAGRMAEPAGRWPDPLLDFQPFALGPEETAALWVTYDVPRDARPRSYQTKIKVRLGEKRKQEVNVWLQVLEFALPETPTLRTAFPLERKTLRAFYGIDDVSLDAWKPIYDALSRSRISYRLWDGGPLVKVDKAGAADTTQFKDHLEYAVAKANMNGIDLGSGENGLAPFPEPAEGELQDPLQFYLHDMGNWLQEQQWLDRAYMEPMALPQRTEWQAARDTYFRVTRNDKRIKRLLVGAGDPYFERYAEIWAVPLRQFDPYVDSLLRQGLSLSFKQPYPAESVTASSSGALPGDEAMRPTQPEDAYDGCLFTFWMSQDVPKPSHPQWLQIDLKDAVTTDRVTVIWRRGLEATEVNVYTSVSDRISGHSGVRWQMFPAMTPYAQSWAEALFKTPATFRSLFLEFTASYGNAPVGVTEVVFGERGEAEPAARIKPLELWLATSPGAFPSLSATAHPIDARIFPWVCWGQQSAGFVHRGLCGWPAHWKDLRQTQPLLWELQAPIVRTKGKRTSPASPITGGPASSTEFLFYPGAQGPIPSIRSELLRDGLEDYEYLVALGPAAEAKKVAMPDVVNLCMRRLYPPNPTLADLDVWARVIAKGRPRMGLAVDEQIRKKGTK